MVNENQEPATVSIENQGASEADDAVDRVLTDYQRGMLNAATIAEAHSGHNCDLYFDCGEVIGKEIRAALAAVDSIET